MGAARRPENPDNPDTAAIVRVIAVCGLSFEAAIAAGPGVATVCAPGPARIGQLLEQLLEQMIRQQIQAQNQPHIQPKSQPQARACHGIISFGTAAGLDPALAPGACVIADAIIAPASGERFPIDGGWLRAMLACLPQARQGTLAGVDQPLAGAADKVRLWRNSGACMADMESHRAALIAKRYGVPFAACRVVVDPAYRNLPLCAIVGLRDNGTTAVMPMLRALASRPGELPALIQLASDAFTAKRALRAIRMRMGTALAIPSAVPGMRH